MAAETSDTVNFASSYKVRRTLNAQREGIQHVRLDLGSGSSEAQAIGTLPISGTVSATSTAYTLRYDEGATYTYVGEAAAGSDEADAVWRIKRVTNADNTILYADGDTDFDKVWTGHSGLSFS